MVSEWKIKEYRALKPFWWRISPIFNRNKNMTFPAFQCVSEWVLNTDHGLRPRLYGEKLSRVEGSPAYPSYPGRANFSYIFLQNLANRLHEKQKVGSARRVTRLAGSPFCDGRVTLLVGPTFLHINTLARLAGSTPSRWDIKSMRELCFQLLARAIGSTFFPYKRSVKLTRLGGWPSCPGQLYSI